ncbi:MAG: c-type cytochrome [Piscinibacter sp.]|uniref:c-type cytochrome n=1 Tax=Piscinibacter sp. TaxID=1903157 RepID=UPI00258FF3BC|nr:c-type cytochrome [Piscinibacter sp.]MCW5667501.1 c-type cytochrome [Piscinibacter sp.]
MRAVMLAAALVAALLADTARAGADAQRGQQAYEARCAGCHSVDADRIGPRHAGLLGRPAGSVAGFDYSDALRRSGITWDAALLERWLADPEALVPGQRMGYRLGDAQARADIVAYLVSLSPGR